MTHFVFVYGSLKMGLSNHRLLRGSRFIDFAKTDPEYTMISFGHFPAVMRGGTTAIHGEVYEVDDETLARLDQLEGHPHFYRREQIIIAGIKLTTYLLPDDYFTRQGRRGGIWEPNVPSGNWNAAEVLR